MSRLEGELTAAIRTVLDESIAAGVFSCAQLSAGRLDRTAPVLDLALGTTRFARYGDGLPVDHATRFDIASVTKAMATSLLAMRAVDDRVLGLDMRLGAILPPGLLHPTQRAIQVADLLRHRSGLPAWQPFFEDVPRHRWATLHALERIRGAVAGLPAEGVPSAVYSDPNYILLAWLLEWLHGESLDRLFASRVAQPLGLGATGYRPIIPRATPEPSPAIYACTENDPLDGVLSGVVHDDNTRAMGGVSGHAGLFSTATDLAAIARELLRTDRDGDGALVEQETLHTFWNRRWLGGPQADGTHVLGWDTPSGTLSSAGARITREHAVGHLGFTGCSVWLDRSRGAWVVFLTNRVHPSRSDARIRALRPRVHDLCWSALDAA